MLYRHLLFYNNQPLPKTNGELNHKKKDQFHLFDVCLRTKPSQFYDRPRPTNLIIDVCLLVGHS